jgi:hypothetical protein
VRTPLSRLVIVALVAASWSAVTAVVSNVASGTLSVAAVFAIATTLGVLALGRMLRGWAPRAGVTASLVVLAWAPLLLFMCADAVNQPFVTSSMRCGTGLMMFLFFAVPIALAVGFAIFGAVGVAFARAPLVDGVLRVAAAAAVVVGVLVTGLALRKKGVDQDAYVDSLAVVADSAGATNGYGFEENRECTVTLPDAHLSVRGWRGSEGPYAVAPDPNDPEKPVPNGEKEHQPCPRRRVLSDARTSTTYVQVMESDPADPLRGWRRWEMVTAVQSGTMMRDVSAHDVAKSLRPPRGWIGGAAAGVSLALAALVWAALLRRRLSRLLGGAIIQGTHMGDGWVEIEGDGRRKLTGAVILPIGPVVIEDDPGLSARERGATYRDDGVGPARLVKRGTVADLLDATRDERANAWALALSSVVLSTVPLLAARLHGLF